MSAKITNVVALCVVALTTVLAGPASGAILYQEPFNTDVGVSGFAAQ